MRSGEQRVAWPGRPFGEEGLQDGERRGGQGRSAVAAPFARAGHVRAGTSMDIAGGQAGELTDAQPGLDCQGQQGPVPPSGPRARVRSCEQRVRLGAGQELHCGCRAAAGRDRQDAGDRVGMLRVVGQREAHDRTDRGEPGVARGHAVASRGLQVVQEPGHEVRVDQREVDLVRRDAPGRGDVLDQQPPRVAVGGDRVRAQITLGVGIVGEVGLQGRGQESHGLLCFSGSHRSAARAMSSGVADRYQ